MSPVLVSYSVIEVQHRETVFTFLLKFFMLNLILLLTQTSGEVHLTEWGLACGKMLNSFFLFCILLLFMYYASVLQLSQSMATSPNTRAIWQWKLVFSQGEKSEHRLIPADILLSMKQDMLTLLASWEPAVSVHTRKYLLGDSDCHGFDAARVATYITLHDIPFRCNYDFSTILKGKPDRCVP